MKKRMERWVLLVCASISEQFIYAYICDMMYHVLWGKSVYKLCFIAKNGIALKRDVVP